MDRAEFFSDELARLETQWLDDGDVSAVAEAIALCGWNDWSLPEWCVRPALDALAIYNDTGSRGQGTRRSRTLMRQRRRQRHYLMTRFLEHGSFLGQRDLTNEQAAEAVATFLKHHNVSGRTVLEDYYEIERTLKPPISM